MTDIDTITPGHVETFLNNYRHEVANIPDRWAEWPTLDHFEQVYYHEEFDRALGDRHVLGLLHDAGRLTPEQAQLIRWMDSLLVEYADEVAEMFEFDVFGGYFALLREPEMAVAGQATLVMREQAERYEEHEAPLPGQGQCDAS